MSLTAIHRSAVLSPDAASHIMAQVFRDIRGDVLHSYPGSSQKSTVGLFDRYGAKAFGLYLHKIKLHAAAMQAFDPELQQSLAIVLDQTRMTHQRMRKDYGEPANTTITHMLRKYPGAPYKLETFLNFAKIRSGVKEHPLAVAGLQEQWTSFVPDAP